MKTCRIFLITALVLTAFGVRAQIVTPEHEARARELVSQMTLDEKLAYIGGYNSFYLRAVPRLGIPEIWFADGPQGIRIDSQSTLFPSGMALAASWDRTLAHRTGAGIGQDARARGIHVMMGPGVNIYRSPLCGRNFEYYGEDPYLAGETAAGYIEGMQGEGVMACMKHFAGNNQEWNRHHISSDIDERTLNEIYLPAFEKGVRRAHVGMVMDYYGLLNGVHATENRYLNIDVLRHRWGFKGIVTSDWEATYTTINAVYNGLDIEMPKGWLLDPQRMKELVGNGVIDERIIDLKVQHVLQTLLSFGFFDRAQKVETIPVRNPLSEQAALDVERGGAVLLRNRDDLLPLTRGKVVVCGPTSELVAKGGGSGEVFPFVTSTVAEGMKKNLGRKLRFGYTPDLWKTDLDAFYADPSCTVRGATAEFFNNSDLEGEPVHTEVVHRIGYKGWESPIPGVVNPDNYSDRYTFYFKPEKDAVLYFSAGGDDGYRVLVDGEELIEQWSGHPFRQKEGYKEFKGGRTYRIAYEHFDGGSEQETMFRYADYLNDPAFIEAVRTADAVVVCVGYDWYLESESWDRPFALPEGHLRCLETILEHTDKAVVVINSGGGVEMAPWIDRTGGVLMAWYQGQQGGDAIAELLTGKISPSGKLPFTLEKRWEDNPVYDNYYPNTDQVKEDNPYKRVEYNEGVFVGYRGYERNGVEPLFPFGFGLSYTTFDYSGLKAEAAGDGEFIVSFDVTNTGRYDAAEVAQLYVGDVESSVVRPAKELKGYEKIFLKRGETRRVELRLDEEAFRHYDCIRRDFVVEPGDFDLFVGTSSQDIRLKTRINVK